MDKTYTVINSLIAQGKMSEAVGAKAISLAEESGMPSLFHLINDCSVDPQDVAALLRQSETGRCVCPKCDGAGSMQFGKGDGNCFLCEEAGEVTIEVAFGWLDQNRCIPGF